MVKKFLYYYSWDAYNNKPVVYDMQVYRGSASNPGFSGPSYNEMLKRYETATGQIMMHSTGPTLDNWKQVV